MIRDILIMLAAVAAVVAFAPKVSHGVNTPAQEAVDAPVTAALPHDSRRDRCRRAAADGFGPMSEALPRAQGHDEARPKRTRPCGS
jgi:hypothetical protein